MYLNPSDGCTTTNFIGNTLKYWDRDMSSANIKRRNSEIGTPSQSYKFKPEGIFTSRKRKMTIKNRMGQIRKNKTVEVMTLEIKQLQKAYIYAPAAKDLEK